ncbi:hypothetical protein ERO13_D13G227000v2 [Gossypium hirsutum]|uniref:N-carbamoylputrescine amidase n=3 Tax=Gossypium TaxID=3633 RepID=A0A1U8MS05_GOSHI|nr:N-carbamoylputrescine amidase-like [Gossypium hirsutum]KAB1996851.1 hypothetical protein ES319_D13G259000v1 [Gossypium barbadense]KAG4113502.1 hypothetical protein ERO13_D13G227000v2 [Gossypium hirsutum]TYI48699.1 hypothetical protein E1A91_D13G265200v1 [Gossypium mustelinum]
MEKGNRQVVVSALQFACTDDVPTNLATAERLVRASHAKGANIILIQKSWNKSLLHSMWKCRDLVQKTRELLLPMGH